MSDEPEKEDILSESYKTIYGMTFDGTYLWILRYGYENNSKKTYLGKLDIHTNVLLGEMPIYDIGEPTHNNIIFDGNFLWIISSTGIYRQLI